MKTEDPPRAPVPLRPVPAPGGRPTDLPVVGALPRERADAARNRRSALSAAERLFRARGVENVSMDDVACEAGVGKGTLYRRFGDRSGLVRALLDEREREFQDALLFGPPPLGPGAPPGERLAAFGRGLLAHLEDHGDLILAAEVGRPKARFRVPVYAAYHQHLMVLLRAARPDLDAEVTADALLAVLGAELFAYLRADRRVELGRVEEAYVALVGGLVSSGGCAGG